MILLFTTHIAGKKALANSIVIINAKRLLQDFRTSESSAPPWCSFLFLYYVFCGLPGNSRFQVLHLILFHDRKACHRYGFCMPCYVTMSFS